MKQQNYFSKEVEALLGTKNWEQLNARERGQVLAEMDMEAYEKYRCLILVSKEMHQLTPDPSPSIKEHVLRRMQQKKTAAAKASWQKWFEWHVPVWQVSLASLAFVILYMYGIPETLSDATAPNPSEEYYQGPVDTVFLDQEQAPEDSSGQSLPYLNSSLQKLQKPFVIPYGRLQAPSSTDRAMLAMEWPKQTGALLPPTRALLNTENTIPLDLIEIQG